MDQVQGIADLGLFHVLGQPNLNIKVDRKKAARFGLNTGDVNTSSRPQWRRNRDDRARGDANGTSSFAFSQIPRQHRGDRQYKVAGGNGGNAYIPLSEIADIAWTRASYIYHQAWCV